MICAIHLISVPLNQWCILTDLFQVLTTHVDRGQRNEAAAQQTPNFDDEEKWQIGQDQVEFTLQHNQSESFKNLNISAFLKLGQVGKEKNQWFPEGTPWLLVPFLLFLCSVEIQLCEKIK